MKKLFRNKVFIAFLILFMGFITFLIWNLTKSIEANGFISISEIEADEIFKNVYLKNDSVVGESVLITYDKNNQNISNYVMLRFTNDKPVDELLNKSSFDRRKKLYSQGFSNFIFWNYPNTSEKIDFKYHYTNIPILQEELSDTVLVLNFDNTNIEISLTEERKKDIELEIQKPTTLVLYKKEEFLYIIYAIRPYDQENKWVSQKELINNLYPLIKNWGNW